MADKDLGRDDGPSLELPSFSLRRKRRKKAEREPDAARATEDAGPPDRDPEPAPATAPEPEAGAAPEPETQAAPESMPASARSPRPEPEAAVDAAPEPATGAQPVAPDDAPTRPQPTVQPDTEAPTRPQSAVQPDTEAPTRPQPAVAADPAPDNRAPSAARDEPVPPANAEDTPTRVSDEESRAADDPAAPPPRRSERAPLRLPSVAGPVAAALTGLVIGLLLAGLSWGSQQGCAAVRGTTSCGKPGFFLLLAILVVLTVLGGYLLRAWGVRDAGSTSFLAMGLLTVVVLLFLVGSLFEWWMVVVVPLVAVLTYLVAHWVTASVAEDA